MSSGETDEVRPYLSVVVVARNDDHGGNLRGRMQAFVNGWISQCNRHRLPAELIIVEWNPPVGRPRLTEALHWPEGRQFCSVRIIEAPPAVHARYRHGDAMPLYQMIGKNAGIRRARGRFVLATNIDIIFSDELVEFLALQQLDPGRMYRMDRHDVMVGVPEEDIAEQLAYCATHLIRVNARDGTHRLTLDGRRTTTERDSAAPEAGILFGEGWFPAEGAQNKPFRWAGASAEIHFSGCGALALDVEPGPSLNGSPLVLQILDGQARQLGQTTIHSRSRLTIPLADGPTVTLRARNVSSGAGQDPRVLSFRAFYCGWETIRGAGATPLGGPIVSKAGSGFSIRANLLRRWGRLQQVIDLLAHSEPVAHVPVRVPSPLKKLLQFYCAHGGVSGIVKGRRAAPPAESRISPLFLHTNACGDFTLLAREKWLDLRGYPEFDLYSMHIDSVFCYAAHHAGVAELLLREPMRIYHIEHGSGWTPEGEAKLFAQLDEKGIPYVRYSDLVGWASQMRRLEAPMIFNGGHWGLANSDLPETDPVRRPQPTEAGG